MWNFPNCSRILDDRTEQDQAHQKDAKRIQDLLEKQLEKFMSGPIQASNDTLLLQMKDQTK
jgi:hypothetical protein